jgi:murein DD-endopeptidase MepM/ murein hydrolase activator NlpD
MLSKPLTFKWLILFLMIGWSCSTLRQPTYNKVIQQTPSELSSTPATIYTVQKGDTLYSIAKRYGITLNELLRLNNLTTSSKLYPGQKLQVKTVSSTPPPPLAEPPSLSQKPTRQVAPNYGNSTPSVTPSTTPSKNKHCAPPVSWQWPTSGNAIGSMTSNGNQGIRIIGSVGQAVRAAANGIVTYSGTGIAGYDNLITIQHNDAFLSVYAHNRKRLVSQGTEVKSGQIIAEMGVDANKQPSLHFEIRCHGKAINPLPFLPQ